MKNTALFELLEHRRKDLIQKRIFYAPGNASQNSNYPDIEIYSHANDQSVQKMKIPFDDVF
ncbi:MAG: hypothetical protein IPH93_03815 [Saprospiraceae bacterium]|nr:hypothetical protein [Saprospiraceae bacterium]